MASGRLYGERSPRSDSFESLRFSAACIGSGGRKPEPEAPADLVPATVLFSTSSRQKGRGSSLGSLL